MFRQRANSLFATALGIVQSRRRRTNLSGLRQELMVHTNGLWQDSWALKTPEWYTDLCELRDKLIALIENHLVSVENLDGFDPRDLVRLDSKNLPEYLREWDQAWEATIKPQIEAIREEYAEKLR